MFKFHYRELYFRRSTLTMFSLGWPTDGHVMFNTEVQVFDFENHKSSVDLLGIFKIHVDEKIHTSSD